MSESHFVVVVMALLWLCGFCCFDRVFFKTSGSVAKLKFTPQQTTKSQSGSRGIAVFFFNPYIPRGGPLGTPEGNFL